MTKYRTKIFIAGHNGFLGKNIKKILNNKNYEVFTINKSQLDLRNRNKVQKYIKLILPDIVINAAGKVGGIKANFKNNAEFLDDNYLIQSNLIWGSFNSKVKKFINISSSCIYPTFSNQPIKEEYLLTGKLEKTNEGYAIAKLSGLKLCDYLNTQYGFDAITLIPCNLYGENDKFYNEDSHFLPGLISKIYEAKKNNLKEVDLWGSGEPKRELIHVSDLAKCIYFFLKKQKYPYRIINIGTGKDFKIKQYANMIKKELNFKGKIIWDTNYPDGMKRKLLDIKKMKEMGFNPKVSFQEGLKKVIREFRKNY